MLLDTLAVTDGRPTASSVGNVIKLPEPTNALTAPAPKPAAITAIASTPFTARTVLPCRRRPPNLSHFQRQKWR